MNKKIILLLALVPFLTTGCTVNYTLKYENDTFTEYVEITGEETDDDAHPTYDEIKENGLYAYTDGSGLFEIDDDSTSTDVKLTHTLDVVDLSELSSVAECFNLSTFKETDNTYYFSAYGGFTCEYLEDSTFTLETDARVLSNNADSVDGNKYIWYLDSDSLSDEGISFQIMKESATVSNVSTDTFLPTWAKILIAVIMIVAGFAFVYMLERVRAG